MDLSPLDYLNLRYVISLSFFLEGNSLRSKEWHWPKRQHSLTEVKLPTSNILIWCYARGWALCSLSSTSRTKDLLLFSHCGKTHITSGHHFNHCAVDGSGALRGFTLLRNHPPPGPRHPRRKPCTHPTPIPFFLPHPRPCQPLFCVPASRIWLLQVPPVSIIM